jgi:hypothetical protein
MEEIALFVCAALAVLVLCWLMERGDSDAVDAVFDRVKVMSDRPANDVCVFAEIVRLRDESALAQTLSADTPLPRPDEDTQPSKYVEDKATCGRARKMRRSAA